MMKQELRRHDNKTFSVKWQSVMFGDLIEGSSLIKTSGVLFFGIILFSSLVTASHKADIPSALRIYSEVVHNDDDTSVCQSKDIRNTVDMFVELQGCKVIEGFVQIVLIDKAEPADYVNVSFPELREITGYLVLYRVQGLKSLSKLFPNLSVIRGNTLFLDYALVVYEMLQLQDIGLLSLTNILRGGVYFAKNPMLCFAESIDWDIIAPHGKGDHHIMGNKNNFECPLCPQIVNANESCPKHASSGEPLCWNMNHCQKSCTLQCSGGCNSDRDCCHPLCLGGCLDKSPHSCFACKHFLYNNECVERCPEGTYEYLNRRCVTDKECLNMPKPRENTDHNTKNKPWKPFKKECVLECPPGHVEKQIFVNGEMRMDCEKCKGICKKECDGMNVDSIAGIQKLRGCTTIKGALEIQVRGSNNMVRELEDNFNTIEEINDYLKIVRSFPLISLNFLPKLREIHGRKLESSKYALVVLDNQNLIELWDWNNRSTSLTIGNGRLFFHFNPKLCYDKIEELRKKTNLSAHSDLEIARNSNGDKTACNVEKLNVTVYKKTAVAALIKWRQFENNDPRTLLGYVVYSIEAPARNVSIYDRRDACDDKWRVDDVSVQEDADASEEKEVNHIIAQLKPYTQYAFYVKTYTIATETRGAQSPIKYFRTEPDIPSEPHGISIQSNSSSELVLRWKPPTNPNGNVTHFIVTAVLEPDNEEDVEQQNFCLEPLLFPDIRRIPSKNPFQDMVGPKDERNGSTDNESCSCNQKFIDNQLRMKEIAFEDYLQDNIFIKRESYYEESPSGKEKREISKSPSSVFDESDNTIPDNMFEDESSDKDNYSVNGVFKRFRQIVFGENYSIVIRNLKHFSKYRISIQACREVEESEDKSKVQNCSKEGVIAGRTLPMSDADNIDGDQVFWEVSNTTHGIVKLKWEEPVNPNSLILTYQIEYWRTDIENYKPTVECISRNQYKALNKGYVLKNLSPGNYSLRIRASSLSGNGMYTKINYFFIEEDSVSPVLQTTIIVIIIMLFIFIIIIPFIVFYIRRHIEYGRSIKLIASVNPEYVPSGKVYTPDDWEVPRENVELIKEIGQGSFGMVYEGTLKDTGIQNSRPCAIKTVSCNSKTQERDRIEFLNEASVMKAFNTHHVVKLLGVVSQGQPTLVIMELMAHGDLKAYLRSCRPDGGYFPQTPPTLKDTLRMAVEIADGMAYLAAKKFVHRDLAARNCMVTDDLTVKIGDFGMTRDIYETEYYRKGSKGLLPVRWMAPECLKDGVFSSLSDVWSYGVVLYEMATLASQPYQGLSNEQVLKFVIDGGVMDRPDNCPDTLYHTMLMCWQQKPRSRPSFMNLVGMLKEHSNPDFATVSFYDSEEGQEIRGIEVTEETPLFVSRVIEDFSLSDDESSNPIKNCSNTGDEDEIDDADDYGDISLRNTSDSWIRSEGPAGGVESFGVPHMISRHGSLLKSNSTEKECKARGDIEDFEIAPSSVNSNRNNGRMTPNGCITYNDVKTTTC